MFKLALLGTLFNHRIGFFVKDYLRPQSTKSNRISSDLYHTSRAEIWSSRGSGEVETWFAEFVVDYNLYGYSTPR